MGLPVQWRISVNGIDASDRMNPYIEGIECTDKEGGSDDTATLTFDDNDGQLATPPKGSPVTIEIEGALVFKGYTDAPESVVSRGGGMAMVVPCTSVDRRGKVKERQSFHKDDGTLEDFLEEAAKKAGVKNVRIDPEFAQIKREYWRAGGESFAHLGRRLAQEFGATFKIRGDEAVFSKRGSGSAPGGGALPSVPVIRGVNLIEARIKPFIGRPRFTKARVRYYDPKKSKHLVEDLEIGNDPTSVDDFLGEARPDKDAAKDAGKGRKAESENESGAGSCTILLAVEAAAGGTATVSGIKPGVDRAYRIASRTHRITRSGMAETSLELKFPQDEGGGE